MIDMESGVDWQKDVAESGLFAKSGKLDVLLVEYMRLHLIHHRRNLHV